MNETTATVPHITTTPENCYYEQPAMTNIRFWLVTVFGSTVSFISIMNNVLLFYVFISRKHHRTNHNVYLMLLAFFDIFVSTAYILLMSVNVLIDYLISPVLMQMWYSYMVPMITISHVAMTSSSFLIVCASFERYCLTVNSRFLPFAQNNRKLIAGFAILFGVISKGTMCLEFEFYDNPECEGLITQTDMRYPDFVFNTPYNVVWRFWYRNFVTVFAPFFILAYFNIRIVKALTKHTKLTVCQLAGNALLEQAKRKMSENPILDPVKRKANARSATRTLVMVVCCYLVSNIISVALTIWEHLDKESLLTHYSNMYAIAVDLVSLLTTSACACRLPIYLACQASLRQEIKEVLSTVFCCCKHKGEDSEYLVVSKTSMAPSPRVNGVPQHPVPGKSSSECLIVQEGRPPKVVLSPNKAQAPHVSAYETLL
uniref:G_PROTEIN_RECEP_F1_2 domain-containing protein n=1 Tax=Haemonchus contortus TaxID=6289 RepID=A0A7I4YRL2_HAECO